MKTPPKYIRKDADTFLLCMQLIRKGRYASAAVIAKATNNKKLTQRIQQKIDSAVQRAMQKTGKTKFTRPTNFN